MIAPPLGHRLFGLRRIRAKVRAFFLCIGLLASFAVLMPARASAGSEEVFFDRVLPDLDRDLPAILDVATGTFASALRPGSFDTETDYKLALSERGDLAFEDADGGLLFVASGEAVALGRDPLDARILSTLSDKLEAREFLRGDELSPGAWFGARSRSGQIVLGRIVSRNASELRLRWVSPLPDQPGEWPAVLKEMEFEVTEGPRTIDLPALGEALDSVLGLERGQLAVGLEPRQPFASSELARLVEGVGIRGDLAYARPRSGLLLIASGRVARIGTGPVARLAGRDLRPRLKDRSVVTEAEMDMGVVFLMETMSGAHALLRVDKIEPGRVSITWIVDRDRSGVFLNLDAFDASFLISDPTQLDRLMLEAASKGDAFGVQKFVKMGADPNSTIGKGGRPALVHAAIGGHTETVALLLEIGASANGKGEDGWAALHVAARLGQVGLVDKLLSVGADAYAETYEGQNALQIAIDSPRSNGAVIGRLRRATGRANDVLLAVQAGDFSSLSRLLDAGGDVDQTDARGRTALQIASKSGQVGAIRALLGAGADPALEEPGTGSALVVAVRANEAEAVSLLLEHGGSSPAQMAAALYAAGAARSPELVSRLLEAGANASGTTGQGASALDHALLYGDDATVNVYLEHGHPLTIEAAARLGRAEELAKLISEEGGGRVVGKPGSQSPVQAAIENDQTGSLRILLDNGFEAGGRLPTWDERSPLHEAAKRTRGDLAALLIERGADPNAVDRMGRTPLYEAVVLGRERVARVLLENGADPNRAPEGEFILDIAHTESLRVMLEAYGARGAPSEKN